MPPLVYSIAGGTFILPAEAVLAAAVLTTVILRRRWIAVLARIVGGLAVVTLAVSAPALPWGWVGAVAVVAWGCVGPFVGGRRVRVGMAVAVLICTAVAAVLEVGYRRRSPLPPGRADTLCVIGDSITAGLGRRGVTTWPTLLRQAHGIHIVDLSRAGCTVGQAVRNATAASRVPGVVVIEVGGNDLIGRADAGQFAADLARLAEVVRGPDRPVVMFELPRFPFDDAYGLAQRRVARAYGIHLVPRRLFAAVLNGPGATVDGVHLSAVGQRRMAELVWQVVGPAMGGSWPIPARP